MLHVTCQRWFIAGAIPPSILGIWQFLSQSTFSSTLLGLTSHPAWQAGTSIVAGPDIGRWLRAYGTFPHPNIFGGYLVVALIVLDRLQKTENSEQKTVNGKRLLSVLCSMLLATALFFTFSRSAWLAYVIWLIVKIKQCYMLHATCYKEQFRHHVSYIMYHVSLIAVLCLIFSPLLLNRIEGESTNESRSTSERIAGYSEAWAIFKEHPLLGMGTGNYTAELINKDQKIKIPPPSRGNGRGLQPGYIYQPAHSVPLLMLAELGAIGILLFALTIFTFIRFFKPSQALLSLLPTIPTLLLDHYLFSSYIGLMLSGIFLGILLSPLHPHIIHREK